MKNADLLAEILQSGACYWVILTEYTYHNHATHRDVVFVGFPADINFGLDRDDIKYIDLKRLNEARLDNVSLCTPYPPFQHHQTLHNAIDGFPVKGEKVREFFERSLTEKSKDLYHYKKIWEGLQTINPETDL